MELTKEAVQKRILKNGQPLAMDKFTWDAKTRTLSTTEDGLVIDFGDLDDCTFATGGDCTFRTGRGCTFTTGGYCTFTTWDGCTFTTWDGCTFTTWDGCTFRTGDDCTFRTGDDCTFRTGRGCTFRTGDDCTFRTGRGCTFRTGRYCTFTTWDGCTFTAGSDCTWAYPFGNRTSPLLHMCGSRYFIECSGPGMIRSGCIDKPVQWWLENIERCAEEHGYTPEQRQEYKVYVDLLAQWMKAEGLL